MRCTQTIRIGGKLPKELAQDFIDAIGDGSEEPSGSPIRAEDITGTWQEGLTIFYYDLATDAAENLFKFCQKHNLYYWGTMEADFEGAESLSAWIPGLTKKPFYSPMIDGNIAFTIDEVASFLRQARKGGKTTKFDLAHKVHKTRLPGFTVIEKKTK